MGKVLNNKKRGITSRRMCSIYCDLKTLNNPLQYVLFFLVIELRPARYIARHKTTDGHVVYK